MGVLNLQVPTVERYPDHEMLEAHRQFVRRLHLSRWKPIRCIKTLDFDGWRGSVAYELDWGEGHISISVLKAFYHKLALGQSLTRIRYFVVTHYSGFPAYALYKVTKRTAHKFIPILRKHEIEIEIVPVRRITKASSARIRRRKKGRIRLAGNPSSRGRRNSRTNPFTCVGTH